MPLIFLLNFFQLNFFFFFINYFISISFHLNQKINWVFKSIKLRRASGSDGIQPYDYVSNIERSLKLNDLNNIIQNFQALPEKMKEPALKWFDKILIRNEIETALNTIIQNSRDFIK